MLRFYYAKFDYLCEFISMLACVIKPLSVHICYCIVKHPYVLNYHLIS